MRRSEARELVALYATWPVIQVDVALILEAARRAGATRLVSEDLQHGRRIAGIAIEDLFGAVR